MHARCAEPRDVVIDTHGSRTVHILTLDSIQVSVNECDLAGHTMWCGFTICSFCSFLLCADLGAHRTILLLYESDVKPAVERLFLLLYLVPHLLQYPA